MRPARNFRCFKGRTHAPSKPVARGGKKVPARPEKRSGKFGFVTPRMEEMAGRAWLRVGEMRMRALQEVDRAARRAA